MSDLQIRHKKPEVPTPGDREAIDPIADLREQYQHVRKQGNETYPLPGWNGKLHIRYGVLDPDRKREILEGPVDRPELGTIEARHAQLLIESCDEVLYGKPDGEVISFPNGTVKLAAQIAPPARSIAEVLGWDTIGSVHDAVLMLFGGKPEAMNMHAITVDRWMRTVYDQADEDTLGGPQVTGQSS